MSMIRYEVVRRRYQFYFDWYMDMKYEERTSIIGKWVFERMNYLIDALWELEKARQQFKSS